MTGTKSFPWILITVYIITVLIANYGYAQEQKENTADTVLDQPEKKDDEKKTPRQAIDDIKETIKKTTGIGLSGFFDVYATNFQNNPNCFALGNFELDLEHGILDHYQFGAALVFNEEGAELAVAFIDYHFYGGTIAPRGKLFAEKGIHFQVGKFDLPFGNDWQYFAAPDNISTQPPLNTLYVTDGGYNDVGLRFIGNFVAFNTTFYIIRGENNGIALGGRFGFLPLHNPYTFKKHGIVDLDFGISYIHDFNQDWQTEIYNTALDFDISIGPVSLRTEFYLKRFEIDNEIKEGFQTMLSGDLADYISFPLKLFTRYDFFRYRFNRPQDIFETNGRYAHRVSGGFNINIVDVLLLKAEYLQYVETYRAFREMDEYTEKSVYAQLVIIF